MLLDLPVTSVILLPMFVYNKEQARLPYGLDNGTLLIMRRVWKGLEDGRTKEYAYIDIASNANAANCAGLLFSMGAVSGCGFPNFIWLAQLGALSSPTCLWRNHSFNFDHRRLGCASIQNYAGLVFEPRHLPQVTTEAAAKSGENG